MGLKENTKRCFRDRMNKDILVTNSKYRKEGLYKIKCFMQWRKQVDIVKKNRRKRVTATHLRRWQDLKHMGVPKGKGGVRT